MHSNVQHQRPDLNDGLHSIAVEVDAVEPHFYDEEDFWRRSAQNEAPAPRCNERFLAELEADVPY